MIVLARYELGAYVLTPFAFPTLEKAQEYAQFRKLQVPTKFIFVNLTQQSEMKVAA